MDKRKLHSTEDTQTQSQVSLAAIMDWFRQNGCGRCHDHRYSEIQIAYSTGLNHTHPALFNRSI
jgi:hypothetical protein